MSMHHHVTMHQVQVKRSKAESAWNEMVATRAGKIRRKPSKGPRKECKGKSTYCTKGKHHKCTNLSCKCECGHKVSGNSRRW